MPYCTISLKLLAPTAQKTQLLSRAMERYDRAYEQLLEALFPEIDGKIKTMSKGEVAKLVSPEKLKTVDNLNVQPFKDALKRDVSKTLILYRDRLQKGRKQRYPAKKHWEEALEKTLQSGDCLSANTYERVLEKGGRRQPLLFCRYSHVRNYALLKNPGNGRYYAKLYLLSADQALPQREKPKQPLVYLDDHTPLKHSRRPCCYVLCPLETGAWQARHLQKLEQGEAVAKSAELVKIKGKFYLHVRLWVEPKETEEPSKTLGVARGIDHALCYALCNEEGVVLRTGVLDAPNETTQQEKEKRLMRAVFSLAEEHKARIVLANLITRNDRLDTFAHPQLRVNEYNRMVQKICYQTEMRGMAPAVVVSARGLFLRCPHCGMVHTGNRMEQSIFLCVACGHMEQLETVGAINLAEKLVQYKREKLDVFYKIHQTEVSFSMDRLGFTYQTENDPQAKRRCLKALKTWLEDEKQPSSKGKEGMIQKLKHARPLESVLRFVAQ